MPVTNESTPVSYETNMQQPNLVGNGHLLTLVTIKICCNGLWNVRYYLWFPTNFSFNPINSPVSIRPIQPLSSDTLSIHPPLTLSFLPPPPRTSRRRTSRLRFCPLGRRRTSPLCFSFSGPAAHLPPPPSQHGAAAFSTRGAG
jgi:hypothetical protein